MTEDIRNIVKKKYGEAISNKRSCCGGSSCCSSNVNEAANIVSGNLYNGEEIHGLSPEVFKASFGCGNPTALAQLHAGETVLDLGSGAGLDVLLSAQRVGPSGKVYGLDMTEEMLKAARQNQEKAGITNVEFLKGYIEDIPLPDNTVDVIISNCVINLSADKKQVLREAFRVLKPGGRFAVSDIVLRKPLPLQVQQDIMAWAGCVAGALLEKDYKDFLADIGFTDIDIEVTRRYDMDDSAVKLGITNLDNLARKTLAGAIFSGFIRAKKPKISLTQDKDYYIRPATRQDCASIKKLLETNELTYQGVEENLDKFLVACTDTEVIGVVGAEHITDAVLLRSLAVKENMRKLNIGATLVQSILEKAKEMNKKDIYLLTNTAEGYFAKKGFFQINRSQIPYELLKNSCLNFSCPSTSICMKLKIN